MPGLGSFRGVVNKLELVPIEIEMLTPSALLSYCLSRARCGATNLDSITTLRVIMRMIGITGRVPCRFVGLPQVRVHPEPDVTGEADCT